jgi:acetyl-CoA carboxylase biotin carboxylase subunit
MRVVHSDATLLNAISLTKAEAGRLRQRRRLHGEVPREPAPRRVPGAGDSYGNAIHLGERDCSCSAATRRWSKRPRPRHHPEQRADRRTLRRGLSQHRLPRRRHLRVPLRGRRVLLHRNEHPRAGRAPGHRDDHRRRYRQGADHRRRRRKLRYSQEDILVTRPRHRVPLNAEHPETFMPSPGRSRNSTRPADPGSASTPTSTPATWCRPTTTR